MTFIWICLALLALIALYLMRMAGKTRTIAAKAEAANPPRGKTIQISTGALHYVERGSGPAVLLIHGLGGNLGHFDMGVIDDLARDHRVVAIDRPGMGYSQRPETSGAALSDQANYAAEVINKLGLERPLVVGHSLGGGTALALALAHPRSVRGLALLAPLTRSTQGASDAFAALGIRNRSLRWLISETLAVPASIKKQKETIDLVFGPDAVPETYSVKGNGLLGLRPSSFRNASRDFVHAQDDLREMEARYDTIDVPVGLLFGTEDRILDHRQQGVELCAAHPQFSLELIEGAGHMLPTNYPEKCAAFIRSVETHSQANT